MHHVPGQLRCLLLHLTLLMFSPVLAHSPWVPLSVAPGLGDEGHDTLRITVTSVKTVLVVMGA